MEAWIERTGEVVVVHLRGRVNYESNLPFRNHCTKHLCKEKVLFNLKDLQFVGSIGVTDFVDTLTQLSSNGVGQIKFCSVSSEFRRLFEASEFCRLEIYENLDKAIQAYQGAPVAPLSRISSEGCDFDKDSGLAGENPD